MPVQPQRRALGSYYTPDWIARWMVRRALATCDQGADDFSWRILDPSCGDGAFLLPALDYIANFRGVSRDDFAGRQAIVRDHVFGVDSDPDAIASAHRRIADWIGETAPGPETESVLVSNFVCGDALTGPEWLGTSAVDTSSEVTTFDHASRATAPCSIDWASAFPNVASAGGFDLIIGNPPYLRERDSKREFDRIAASALGKRWRTARMDLWHYFLHRGLDLLKPGGVLSFIVNSYWTSSTAAAPLRRRLSNETSMEEMVLLGPARLFRNVSGRHMIFRAHKEITAEREDHVCQIQDLSRLSQSRIQETFDRECEPRDNVRSVPQAKLWSCERPRLKDKTGLTVPLGEVFDVRQGIAENPPFVTRSAAELLGDRSLVGQGVFVLTNDEVAELNLSPLEQALLRPYYALSTISRFHVASRPSHRILYLTRRTAPDLDAIPTIARHLERFRPILDRRREVQSKSIDWWHLHWPREERLFTNPRILCLQMGHQPRFAYAQQPTFVGFSMHVIVERKDVANQSLSLPALAAVLNSARARQWFETRAKRRGAHLDISGTILKQFPLPATSHTDITDKLTHLTETWQGTPENETQLNVAVEALYESAGACA